LILNRQQDPLCVKVTEKQIAELVAQFTQKNAAFQHFSPETFCYGILNLTPLVYGSSRKMIRRASSSGQMIASFLREGRFFAK